jgi:hypothetical protein
MSSGIGPLAHAGAPILANPIITAMIVLGKKRPIIFIKTDFLVLLPMITAATE